MIYPHILSLVGHTPLVEIRRLNPKHGVTILAKMEYFNPGGSIKDRVALSMIEAAERAGELTPDKVVIEATSGNTGIGLAMVCAVKGYKLRLLMPDSASEERKRIMRAFGADIMLTPGRLGTDGAIEEAYRLVREEPDTYVLMDQFNNPASIDAHYKGTGLEIWEQTEGKVTHVVSTLGTSGTAMGLVKRLKEMNPEVVCVAVEPYAGHKIQGLKNMQESYPPGIYDKKCLDTILRVEDEEAFDLCRRLAREEGLLVGMSSGAAMAGALKLASTLEHGTIVVIFPDSGERYLSTSLFAQTSEQGMGLFNIVTGKKTYPSPGTKPIGLYTIGPSLDDLFDAEAWRRVTLLDALGRYLEYKGHQVRFGVGMADLDDRALAEARKRNIARLCLAEEAVNEVRRFASHIGISQKLEFFTADSSLERMLTTTKKLLSRGLAYEKLRSVYFDIERDKSYGQMIGLDPDKLSLGKTVDLANYVKEHPRDFTLWKRATLQDLKRGDFLQTEWGNVRPSWFLQHACAAQEHVGALSIVLAGQVHRFPHLENLRAIWSLGGGVYPDTWLVSQPVESKDKKSIPGLNAFTSLAVNPRALRLWLLSTSYRKSLVFSEQSLAMWSKNWRKIQDLAVALRLYEGKGGDTGDEVRQALFDLKSGFTKAFEDDLGLHHFWPVMFDFCRTMNRLIASGRMNAGEAESALNQLFDLDSVLGILDEAQMPLERSRWPENIRHLVAAREEARRSKDFQQADQLRVEIESHGFRLEDGPDCSRLLSGL